MQQITNGNRTTRENKKYSSVARANCLVKIDKLKTIDDLKLKNLSKDQLQDYTPIVVPFHAIDTPRKSGHKTSRSLTRNEVLNYLKEKKIRENSSHKSFRMNSERKSALRNCSNNNNGISSVKGKIASLILC